MKIDLYHTLKAFHAQVTSYNRDKLLKDQLRAEINTGELLLKLLHDNHRDGRTNSPYLLQTNLYSLMTLKNIHTKRTIKSHLINLHKCGIINEIFSKRMGRRASVYELVFDPRFVILFEENQSKIKRLDVDNLWITCG